MCGRVTIRTPPKQLAEALGFVFQGGLTEAPRFNVAPAALIPAVLDESPGVLAPLRWGLIPRWAKDAKIAQSLSNARAETVREKPAFREAFKGRRCLVVVDGFYEWRREGKSREAFHFTRTDGAPLAFAGLWDEWQPPVGDPVRTCSVITCASNGTMAPVHDRMPVILERPDFARWLEGDPAFPLVPAGEGVLTVRAVSARVNDARHDAEDCLAPPEPAKPKPQLELF
jgi:putative SOS response-associated peptidase YedK